MGWWGVVFKGDISSVSDQLAIGLTTGYLGSLTTFSGWNQKMLDLSVDGQWVFSVLGFLIGNLSFCKNHVIVEALTSWTMGSNENFKVRLYQLVPLFKFGNKHSAV